MCSILRQSTLLFAFEFGEIHSVYHSLNSTNYTVKMFYKFYCINKLAVALLHNHVGQHYAHYIYVNAKWLRKTDVDHIRY